MENPIKFESLHPNRNNTQFCTHPSSPEFEFWMVRNPSLPQPNILSADELFSDGVLLPLHLLTPSAPSHDSFTTETVVQENEDSTAGPEITSPSSAAAAGSGSRRWKDMFKKPSKEPDQKLDQSTKFNKKRERIRSGGHGGSASSSAELNINIWPFSRSGSAGNNSSRLKTPTSRKVSSAPCSRSNSGGESKSRKWPASPGRPGGVPVGRSSPVWQVRRGASAMVPRYSTSSEYCLGSRKSSKAKVLKSCKQGGDLGGGRWGSGKGSGGSIDGSGVVNLFSLRSLFGKKVY